jgi:hypothetical protein
VHRRRDADLADFLGHACPVLLLQFSDGDRGVLFRARDGAPAGDDLAVVAESDSAAGQVLPVWVQDEVHRALGPYAAVERGVPAHEDLAQAGGPLGLGAFEFEVRAEPGQSKHVVARCHDRPIGR